MMNGSLINKAEKNLSFLSSIWFPIFTLLSPASNLTFFPPTESNWILADVCRIPFNDVTFQCQWQTIWIFEYRKSDKVKWKSRSGPLSLSKSELGVMNTCTNKKMMDTVLLNSKKKSSSIWLSLVQKVFL